MNERLGRWLVFGAVFITVFLWLVSAPVEYIEPYKKLIQVLGGVMVVSLVLSYTLSVRHRTIERWFGGLSALSSVRRKAQVFTGVLFLIHIALVEFTILNHDNIVRALGILAVFVFVGVMLLTMLVSRDASKQRYMAYLFQLLVLFALGLHMFVASSYGFMLFVSPLSMWMSVMILVGGVSLLYTAAVHPKRKLAIEGVIYKVRKLNELASECTVRLSNALELVEGQFVYVGEMTDAKYMHPLYVSGISGREIMLVYQHNTGVASLFEKGKTVAVEGPYGHLDFDTHSANSRHIWIAGGMGIVPFIAAIRARGVKTGHTTLFYTYRGRHQALFLGLLRKYASDHRRQFQLHTIDTEKSPRLEVDDLHIRGHETVYICGPKELTTSLRHSLLRKTSLASKQIVTEHFEL